MPSGWVVCTSKMSPCVKCLLSLGISQPKDNTFPASEDPKIPKASFYREDKNHGSYKIGYVLIFLNLSY